MELKKCKLGELIDVSRGQSLSGEYYATEGKYIRLTCGNFDYNNNCFKENTSKDDLFFTGTIKPEFIMKKGDIITPLTEQAIGLLGSTAIIPENDKYIQSQDVAKIICKENKLDHDFAFYLISSKLVKKQLSVAAQQTKIRHTSPDKIKDCTVWVPDIKNQRRIASVLSTLDRKISLNRSINKELEAMAKEIYDYWFVQFDFPDENGRPYKSSGGEMVYNPVLKREVPKGWEVKSLKDIATFTNGLACQKFRPTNENKLPVIKIREMHGGFTADTEFVKSDIPEKVKVYNGDILFSWSASLEVMLWAYGKGGLNQHIFKVTSNNDWPKSFYYYQLLSYIDVFKKMAEARKTTMGHITEEHLEQSRIAVPPSVDIATQLDSKLAPIFEKIVATSEEITLLQNQRDELLPLLMTGQVTIE